MATLSKKDVHLECQDSIHLSWRLSASEPRIGNSLRWHTAVWMYSCAHHVCRWNDSSHKTGIDGHRGRRKGGREVPAFLHSGLQLLSDAYDSLEPKPLPQHLFRVTKSWASLYPLTLLENRQSSPCFLRNWLEMRKSREIIVFHRTTWFLTFFFSITCSGPCLL